MKSLWLCGGLLPLVWITLCLPAAQGGRYYLRPMSAEEVYRALREAGREDAVPEGRVVSQGVSGWAGFGLGLLKGIGGAAVVNALATAMNNNAASSGGTTLNEQEICFNSRSVDGAAQGRQAETGTGATTAATSPTTTSDSPTTSVNTGDGGTQTNVDDGTGSGTATETETEDNGGQTTNCIVIQKPA